MLNYRVLYGLYAAALCSYGFKNYAIKNLSKDQTLFCSYLNNNLTLESRTEKIMKEEDLRGKTPTDIWKYIAKLNEIIVEGESNFNRVNSTLCDLVETLAAREHGSRANNKVLSIVFPGCSKKPFRIRTLSNLIEFIRDPSKAVDKGLCCPEAVIAWNEKISDNEKIRIQKNIETLLEDHPTLLASFQRLKGLWVVAHNTTDIQQGIQYFDEADSMVARALIDLLPFQDNNS